MKFCQKHWDELKEAIKERGLYEFVPKSGEEAAEQMKEQLEGNVDEDKPFDPLMSAHWGIVNNFVEQGGGYIMFGEYCPLCELEKHTHEGVSKNWITGCTDDILEHFRTKGWVQSPN